MTYTNIGLPGELPAAEAPSSNDAVGLAITIEVDDDDVIVIRGDLDVATAPMASRFVNEHSRPSGQTVFDLGELEFMDSSGLRVLLLAANRATKHGGSVRLRAVAPAVERLLMFTGTAPLFEIPADGDGPA